MKNLKRFVVVFMTAALFSTSFTSCIDNDVDPAVMSIYRSQADLIAAQVALLEAEAALLEAQAAHEQAMADIAAAEAERIAAITEGIMNDNAYEEMVRMQQLMVIEAETAAEVARLQNEMALAQQEFEIEMAQLMAELEAAGAQLAMGYAQQYAYAMGVATNLKNQKLMKENQAADIETDLALEIIDMQEEFDMLQEYIDNANAEIEMINQMIAEYQAVLDDPSNSTNQVVALEEQRDALYVQADELEIEIANLYNQLNELYDQLGDNDEIITEYENALADHDYYVGIRDGLIDANSDLADDIADWTLALNDWDAALAALTQTFLDAEQAIADAWTALGMTDGAGTDVMYDDYFEVDADGDPIAAGGVKYGTPANLQETYVDARIDAADAMAALTAAQTALTDLQAVIDSLEASLNAAAATLAAEQTIYDAGIGAATAAVTTAQTGVTNADAALLVAQNNYEAWKTIFEANPDGYTWSEPGTDAFAAELANQDPDSGVNAVGYVRVSLWDAGTPGPDDNFPADYEGPVLDALPAEAGITEVVIPNGTDVTTYLITDADETNSYPNVGYTIAYYYEVGADDVAQNNLAEFQAATTALGNEDIFDNPPMLGDVPSLETGAWADLWNAQLALIDAQDALDNFGVALAAAQEAYDELKAVYENELTLLDAAQQAVVDAQAAYDAADAAADDAQDAVDAAWDELGPELPEPTSTDPKVDVDPTLEDQSWNAYIDWLIFQETSKEDLAMWIANAEETIASNEILIAEFQIIIDALFTQVSMLQEAYDEAILTPIDAALEVQIYATWYNIDALYDLQSSLWMQASALQNTINAIVWYADGYIDADTLEYWIMYAEDDIMYLEEDIEYWTEMQTMSEGEQLEYDAWVAMKQREWDNLMDQIAGLEAEIANWETLAAEYKALMEAALSS